MRSGVIANSWGDEWGDKGHMNIVRSSNKGPAGTGNNLVETACNAADVYAYTRDAHNPGKLVSLPETAHRR